MININVHKLFIVIINISFILFSIGIFLNNEWSLSFKFINLSLTFFFSSMVSGMMVKYYQEEVLGE